MHRLREDLIQFIWKHRLLVPGPLRTTNGNTLKVIKPGELNTDSGPDYFNALIEINGVSLAGNIEVHVRTSDWARHHHDKDPAYDRIILHVVFEHDRDLPQNSIHGVEVLQLKDHISTQVLERYAELASSPQALPCASQLHRAGDMQFLSWLTRMRVERLEHKTKRIASLFREYRGDYAQVMYTLLLSNFGFRINSVPFELLARHLPLPLLLRHRDQVHQLEALLLGTAGMLNEQLSDKYLMALQNEYCFLSAKYGLVPLDKSVHKFSRLRPSNFPALRLAQFAAFVHHDASLLVNPVGEADKKKIVTMLTPGLSPYWRSHYTTGGKKSEQVLRQGVSSAENVIINTIAPFFFFYGDKTGSPGHKETAIRLYDSCAPEDNVKTRLFRAKEHLVANAGDTQGLINLFDQYCSLKKCLGCAIGTRLIAAASAGESVTSQAGEPEFIYL